MSIDRDSARRGNRNAPPAWWWAITCLFLMAWIPAARADVCAGCSGQLGFEFYLATDKVTDEKKPLCKSCVMSGTTCFLCGLPVKAGGAGITDLPDGRHLCARDSATAVLSEIDGQRACREVKNELDRVFSRFLSLPETNVVVEVVDRVHLQELFRYAGNDYDCPNVWGYMQSKRVFGRPHHRLSVLSGLPLSWFQSTCAHEYGHGWINENVPAQRRERLARDAQEGFCELLSYLFAQARNDEAAQARIKRNSYTRGQIHLFLEAEQRFGFNDVLEWMVSGTDARLDAAEPDRVHQVNSPRKMIAPATRRPAYTVAAAPSPRAAAPEQLALKAVFWSERHPTALINNHTFAVSEEGQVRLGATNLTVRCLGIRQDAVKIRIVGSGEERELRLNTTGS